MHKATTLKPSILFSALAAALLVWCAIPAAADELKELTICSPKEGWPPFIIPEDELGQERGIMIDVLREAASRNGYTIKIVHLPEKRAQMVLKEGGVDAHPKAMEWVDNPDDFNWTDPIVESTDVVIIRRHNERSEVPRTLTGFNLGVMLGYVYPALEEYFQDGSIKRRDARTTESLLRMVLRDHVDAAVTNQHVANWIIHNNDDLSHDDFVVGDKPIDSAPYRFAFTKAWYSLEFIKLFNRELKIMKKDGTFETILNRYK